MLATDYTLSFDIYDRDQVAMMVAKIKVYRELMSCVQKEVNVILNPYHVVGPCQCSGRFIKWLGSKDYKPKRVDQMIEQIQFECATKVFAKEHKSCNLPKSQLTLQSRTEKFCIQSKATKCDTPHRTRCPQSVSDTQPSVVSAFQVDQLEGVIVQSQREGWTTSATVKACAAILVIGSAAYIGKRVYDAYTAPVIHSPSESPLFCEDADQESENEITHAPHEVQSKAQSLAVFIGDDELYCPVCQVCVKTCTCGNNRHRNAICNSPEYGQLELRKMCSRCCEYARFCTCGTKPTILYDLPATRKLTHLNRIKNRCYRCNLSRCTDMNSTQSRNACKCILDALYLNGLCFNNKCLKTLCNCASLCRICETKGGWFSSDCKCGRNKLGEFVLSNEVKTFVQALPLDVDVHFSITNGEHVLYDANTDVYYFDTQRFKLQSGHVKLGKDFFSQKEQAPKMANISKTTNRSIFDTHHKRDTFHEEKVTAGGQGQAHTKQYDRTQKHLFAGSTNITTM